jgi:hypothetical protein
MTKPREEVIFILMGALIVGLIGTVMAGGTLTGGAIVLVFLVLAFWGLFAGLIVWILYRAIRHAVRG